ncbi:hypothetical protein [Haliscomenobacter sp.]|uniref:hypothetical protein n=1 Tax=Haliscomenobacter sp. TaxID=2717303 RepID=UPI003592FA0C
MKNQSILLLSLLLLLGFVACKNDGKNDGETKVLGPNDVFEVDAPPITGPESIAEVEKLVKGIDAVQDSMNVAGPNFVFNGKEKTEVFVYSYEGMPQMVYCKTPKLESWYYLKDRRPVYLKELALTESGFVQNRFYYGPKDLIGAESREGASPDDTNKGAVKKYRGAKDDFRLSGEAATGKVLEYLYGKMK